MPGDVNGYVPCTTGSNIQATVGLPTPSNRVGAQSVRIQADPGNAALVYIGGVNMDPTSGVGVWGVLAVPVSGTQGPFPVLEFTQYSAPGGLNVADFYVRGTTNDAVIVSYI